MVSADGSNLPGNVNFFLQTNPDGFYQVKKIPPGRYARYLKKANEYLEKARAAYYPDQAKAIGALIR
jgi:hypothetical protein